MKLITFGKATQKLALLCLFLLLPLISGCGSSGGDDPMSCPGDPGCEEGPGPDVDMQGTWWGSTDTQMFGELSTSFNLTQDGSNVGGTLQLTDTDGTSRETEDVSGSISNSTVTISAIYPLREGGQAEFVFEGTVTDETYSGNVKLFENGTETNQGGTFSLTKNGTGGEFTGEWELFEEQERQNYYRQYRYTVRIEQTGTQATLSKGNDHMTCNVVAEDLVCDGTFFYEEDESSSSFDTYRLRHDGNNGLTGEASWTTTSQGNDYYGRSNLTTTRPDEGSIRFFNLTDYTFRLLNLRPCGSSDWSDNQFNDGWIMEPEYSFVRYNLQSGCYDVRICEETWESGCDTEEDVTVNGGETLRLTITIGNSLRLNQNGINPEQFNGSLVHEFKSPGKEHDVQNN